jgi:hypothetical protein
MDLAINTHVGLGFQLALSAIFLGNWGYRARIRPLKSSWILWLMRELGSPPLLWLWAQWSILVPLDYFVAQNTGRNFFDVDFLSALFPLIGGAIGLMGYRKRKRENMPDNQT